MNWKGSKCIRWCCENPNALISIILILPFVIWLLPWAIQLYDISHVPVPKFGNYCILGLVLHDQSIG